VLNTTLRFEFVDSIYIEGYICLVEWAFESSFSFRKLPTKLRNALRDIFIDYCPNPSLGL